jgi:hypothetical protein
VARGNARIGLVLPGYGSGTLQRIAPAAMERLRLLESTCARANIALVPVTYYYAGTHLRFHRTGRGALTRWAGDTSVLGFMLFTAGASRPASLTYLLDRVMAAGRPVAVLDQTGTGCALSPLDSAGRARVFPLALGTAGGRAAAHYLLGMGHRRIAYISPYHDVAWSRTRLQGLREAAAMCTPAAEIRAFTCEYTPTARTSPGSAQLQQMARSLLASALPGPRSQRNLASFSVNRLAETIAREAVSEGVRPALQPLFEEALRKTGITAWVGANDTVSSRALWFLRRARTPVPSRISVMGFDDSEEAFRQNLTSYNWNASGIMAAMVSHILDWRPSRSRAASTHPVEVEGFVTERGSVARRRT